MNALYVFWDYFIQSREITGYLLLGYVKGVDTFAHLFPNLVVIRGNIRIANKYSLMVWSNDHLEHVSRHLNVYIYKCDICREYLCVCVRAFDLQTLYI